MHPVIPLLQLVHTLKRIEGRKKLQKTVHILKELGAPFSEQFEYSYYGMYSLQLKDELAVLESENLVNEECIEGSNMTYIVESTPELERLMEEFELLSPPAWSKLASRLNSLTPKMLEGVSTILFLRRIEIASEIRRKLLELKPHLSDIVDNCFEEESHLKSLA